MKNIIKFDITFYILVILSILSAQFKNIIILFLIIIFHELGHIYHGHIDAGAKFIDYHQASGMETEANHFAVEALVPTIAYESFVSKGDFSLSAISAFAKKHGVKPYIVIGRLQKHKKISYNMYSKEKLRYKWIKL